MPGKTASACCPRCSIPQAKQPVREDVICHSLRGDFSICRGEWKLIEHRGSGGFSVPVRVVPKPGEPAGQLYNLRRDPQETRNVYAEYPDVVARFAALLNRYRSEGRSRG